MLMSYLLVALHFGLMAAVIVRVLLRRPARGVAMAWLLLAVALPYAGAVAYFLIGERRLPRSREERLAQFRADIGRIASAAPADAGPQQANGLQQAARSFFGTHPVPGNRLALHAETLKIIPAIAADIDAARRAVLIEFYIWSEGGLTQEVLQALIRAASRGVSCLVLIDAMGAGRWWKGSEPRLLREAGVQLRPALPVGLFRGLFGRTDIRVHRKIVVIDGAVAWTGSMNMVDPRFFKQDAGVGEWVDAMTRLEGPAAMQLAAVMLGDWMAEEGGSLEEMMRLTGLAPGEARGQVPVQVMASGPHWSGDGLLQIMLALINGASRELVLTTPYFVPEDALVTALRGAVARGVRVVVILPEKIDSFFVRYASRSFFDEIMDMGGEIHEFGGGLLHTKSITADGEVSLFGTANFDMRSLWLNYEVSMLVYDEAFTRDLRALQQGYLAASRKLASRPWANRPLAERLLVSTMRLMSPLL
jgi:cardiolipin synthase